MTRDTLTFTVPVSVLVQTLLTSSHTELAAFTTYHVLGRPVKHEQRSAQERHKWINVKWARMKSLQAFT